VIHIRRHNTTFRDVGIDDTIVGSSYCTEFNRRVQQHNKKYSTNHGPFYTLGHRDAVQLIPKNRYTGGVLDGVSIINIKVVSKGKLQGVFSSDGAYRNLNINHCDITTNSKHKITIAGVLSGVMYANTVDETTLLRTVLLPLRIGGGLNYNIISFSPDSKYQYKTVHGKVIDKRTTPRRRSKSVYGFNMELFQRELGVMYYNSTKELLRNITAVMAKLEKAGRIKIVEEK
jgi:hypothetical protein